MVSDGLVDYRDHPVKLPASVHEHPPLKRQRFVAVIVRICDNLLDLHQGKPQLPKKQDLLQSFQIGAGVIAVSGIRLFLRLQKPDLIIVVQRAHTDPRQLGDFLYLHPLHLPSPFTLKDHVT
ncbi:hypothetical protein D3C71_1780220 [compost metagenome]